MSPTYTPQPPQPATSQTSYDSYGPTPPTPHPAGSSNGGHNPYEFIFSEKHEAKQSLFGGGSMLKRVLFIVGGLVVLGVLATVVVSLLSPKDTSYAQLTTILQQQQEIVRVAELSQKSASTSDLKNLSINVSLSVGADKNSLQTYLTTRKVKITDTILAAKQDSKTDTLLANAKSANTFDATAAQTLQSLLVTYRADLNTTYQSVKGTNARAELKTSYQNADLLIAEANRVVGQ